jgi:hypothetical protein
MKCEVDFHASNNLTSKQKREKDKEKSRNQDDSDDKGMLLGLKLNLIKKITYLNLAELIQIYDGDISLQNRVFRTISLPKNCTYQQLLVRFFKKFKFFSIFSIFFKQISMKTFHLNEDSFKYYLTIPVTDENGIFFFINFLLFIKFKIYRYC